jgi:hypothetical protein
MTMHPTNDRTYPTARPSWLVIASCSARRRSRARSRAYPKPRLLPLIPSCEHERPSHGRVESDGEIAAAFASGSVQAGGSHAGAGRRARSPPPAGVDTGRGSRPGLSWREPKSEPARGDRGGRIGCRSARLRARSRRRPHNDRGGHAPRLRVADASPPGSVSPGDRARPRAAERRTCRRGPVNDDGRAVGPGRHPSRGHVGGLPRIGFSAHQRTWARWISSMVSRPNMALSRSSVGALVRRWSSASTIGAAKPT